MVTGIERCNQITATFRTWIGVGDLTNGVYVDTIVPHMFKSRHTSEESSKLLLHLAATREREPARAVVSLVDTE